MKSLSLIVLGAAFVLFSCNDNTRTDKIAPAPPDTPVLGKDENTPTPATAEACYAKMNNKDTVQLRISMNGSAVTGSLVYKIYEKDSNKGQLQGTLHGDTLIADYTFQSEGSESVREVAFLIKDSSATEGYGKVQEKNGRMVFTKPSALTFGKSMVLKQVPCGDIAN